jgi:hypothetical protein
MRGEQIDLLSMMYVSGQVVIVLIRYGIVCELHDQSG